MPETLASLSTAEPTDHALMVRVRDGDVACLGDLFERHHRALFAFFHRLTGDHAGSEDLVQLFFYRALRYRHTYQNTGNFTPWMYHIARRLIGNYYQRASTRHTAAAEINLEFLPDATHHAGDVAAEKDEAALLHRALQQMPPDEREIIVLARFQELPYVDIARILDLSLSNVKTRVHRALKTLREIYFRLNAVNPARHPKKLTSGGTPS